MKENKHIHFIGIGGSSMNGLALIMKDKGYQVTGSDCAHTAFTDNLEKNGIKVFYEQIAENITDPDFVVYTAAISKDNPELNRALEKGIPTIERADFLGKITEEYANVVGVAGCHGKTTITSMIAKIMMEQQPSPTVHIGGNVPFLDGGTHIGDHDLFITEACEYVNSFHKFHVTTAVINNIDDDHLDFFKTIENIYESFKTFANKLPEDGYLIANVDDPWVKKIADQAKSYVITYALESDANFTAKNIHQYKDSTTSFDIFQNGVLAGNCVLSVPGRHNIQNALAAIIVAYYQDIPIRNSIKILKEYKLTNRRFEYYGERNGAKLYHDYAHHPTEIAACINTAKELTNGKIVAVFQCHTFSRAINHMNEYAKILAGIDEVLVPDIYAARQQDTGAVHATDIVDAINKAGGKATYFKSFEQIDAYLDSAINEGDILLLLGAGDIDSKSKIFVK